MHILGWSKMHYFRKIIFKNRQATLFSHKFLKITII